MLESILWLVADNMLLVIANGERKKDFLNFSVHNSLNVQYYI